MNYSEQDIKAIQELLKFPVNKIKQTKSLLQEFKRLYVLGGGNPQDCMSCNMSSAFNRWKRQVINQSNSKVRRMISKNTFELKNPKKKYRVPRETFIFSSICSDEEAIYWINHKTGDSEKKKLEFNKLPDALLVKEVKKEQVKPELKEEVDDNVIKNESKPVVKKKRPRTKS